MKAALPRVLTIAGSDSGGGAGIQADLKTITAMGGFGMSAVTALTAQNTCEVRRIHELPADFVAAQIDAVVEDIGLDAAKTGMLANAPVVEVVADRVAFHRIQKLVVDPVMLSRTGAPLLRDDARGSLKSVLLPLALVVTPNLAEAEVLARMPVRRISEMREAAKRIAETGCRWVLVKGGHLEGEPVDVLFDGKEFLEVVRDRVVTKNTHGTGCTYSAAIAVELARGLDVGSAVWAARDALQSALQNALPLGAGCGPVNHASAGEAAADEQ